MRQCNKCSGEFSDSDFYEYKPGRLKRLCKNCHRAMCKQYYDGNKDKVSLKHRTNRAEKYKKLHEYKAGKGCVDCGEKDPIVLDFDHDDRDIKRASISKMVVSRITWGQVLEEIEKCTVRCANCHRRRTAKQLGWYE